MGIGNTTPATCLACWLTGGDPADARRPGHGPRRRGRPRARPTVIARALDACTARDRTTRSTRSPRLGGGEIALLIGLALGAGEHGLGYVCDGVIATAAAAIAAALAPDLSRACVAGHLSPEPAHAPAARATSDLKPILDLEMRLGEASGAAAALAVLKLAAAAHGGMHTFAEAGVSTG